jgi:hypothetical protein
METVISTSGNRKTKRPVVEKAVIVQTVLDMTKLHVDFLQEISYAESIDEIISGL